MQVGDLRLDLFGQLAGPALLNGLLELGAQVVRFAAQLRALLLCPTHTNENKRVSSPVLLFYWTVRSFLPLSLANYRHLNYRGYLLDPGLLGDVELVRELGECVLALFLERRHLLVPLQARVLELAA